MYLRNAWYVAARADEVGRELSAHTLLEDNVVLFREEGGRPVALEDACRTKSSRCRWAASRANASSAATTG